MVTSNSMSDLISRVTRDVVLGITCAVRNACIQIRHICEKLMEIQIRTRSLKLALVSGVLAHINVPANVL